MSGQKMGAFATDGKSFDLWNDVMNKGYWDAHDIWAVNDKQYSQHLATFIFTICFFSVAFVLNYNLLKYIIKPDFFTNKKTDKEKYLLIMLINGNLHHLVVVAGVLHTVFNMCDRPFGMFLGDEICIRTYKPFYSHMIVYTGGYFLFDLFMQLFFYQDFSPLGYQNIGHHLASLFCFYCAFVAGRSVCMQTHIVMICEFSQIFLNLRNSIGKKATGIIPLLNNICFILTFTMCRIVLFPLLIMIHFMGLRYYDFWNTGYYKDHKDDPRSDFVTSRAHQTLWIFTLLFFVMILGLNLYWYSYIINGIISMIQGDATGGDPGSAIEDTKKKTQDKKKED